MDQCEEHVVLECGVLYAQEEKLEKEGKYWIHNEKHEKNCMLNRSEICTLLL
jgi:hypothetical protein